MYQSYTFLLLFRVSVVIKMRSYAELLAAWGHLVSAGYDSREWVSLVICSMQPRFSEEEKEGVRQLAAATWLLSVGSQYPDVARRRGRPACAVQFCHRPPIREVRCPAFGGTAQSGPAAALSSSRKVAGHLQPIAWRLTSRAAPIHVPGRIQTLRDLFATFIGVVCHWFGVIWDQITPVFMVLTHSHNIIILPCY